MSDGTLGDARRQAEETRRALRRMRTRRQAMLRDARELRRRSDRSYGRMLGERLSDPEPVDNESWFEFLLEHPELTGWNNEAAPAGLQP